MYSRCRRQDLQASPTYSPQNNQWRPSTSHSRTNASVNTLHNIVPQMIPSPPPTILLENQAHGVRHTVKPGTTRVRSRRIRPPVDRSESEAARYLAQFHSQDRPPSRPRGSRLASSTEDASPGLSSTASSLTSISTPPTPGSSLYQAPSRKNRWSSAFATQSLELVTPTSEQSPALSSSLITVTAATAKEHCIPSVSMTPPEDHLPFEKRKPVASSEVSSGRGSLKQLFTSGGSHRFLAEEA